MDIMTTTRLMARLDESNYVVIPYNCILNSYIIINYNGTNNIRVNGVDCEIRPNMYFRGGDILISNMNSKCEVWLYFSPTNYVMDLLYNGTLNVF